MLATDFFHVDCAVTLQRLRPRRLWFARDPIPAISGPTTGRRSLCGTVSIGQAKDGIFGRWVGITVGAIGGTVLNTFLSQEDEQGSTKSCPGGEVAAQ